MLRPASATHPFSSQERSPMRPSMTAHRPGTGLLYLITSGLLWGTGGLTGSLLGRVAGLSAMSVAACRLSAGGMLIVIFLTVTGRRWPAGRTAWTRIAVIGVLAALYQSCYFTAVALTSVALATLVTIGTAPVIVLGVYRVTGRRAGRLAPVAACLALAGLGLLVGLPSGFPETAVLASAGMAVLAAAGFATLTLTGARPVPGLDDLTVTGFGFTLGGLVLLPVAAARGDRVAHSARHRPDRGGVHALLPGPAPGSGQHCRPAGPARAPDRHRPSRARPRPAAERNRDRRGGHPAGRGSRHRPRIRGGRARRYGPARARAGSARAGSAGLPVTVQDLGVQRGRGRIGRRQEGRDHSAPDGGQRERDVLDADVRILKRARLSEGQFQDLLGHRGERDVAVLRTAARLAATGGGLRRPGRARRGGGDRPVGAEPAPAPPGRQRPARVEPEPVCSR